MITYPNAKINLGLNVTERLPNGYHNIETIFYPIPLCDTLQVETEESMDTNRTNIFPEGCLIRTEEADDYTLHTGGTDIGCPAEKNLIIKVLRNLQEDFKIPYLHIALRKEIPSGAGLGGGSSDAAYMMKLLNDLFNLGLTCEEMEERVSTLGADCAFFIRNRPTLATGIGNVFTPINLSLNGWHALLLKPDIFVSTKEAYSHIRPHKPETPVTTIINHPVEAWKGALGNDFEDGIFAIHPEIADIKEKLYEAGATYAAMSGSGSSVFGIFRSPLHSAQELFPECFCRQFPM